MIKDVQTKTDKTSYLIRQNSGDNNTRLYLDVDMEASLSSVISILVKYS